MPQEVIVKEHAPYTIHYLKDIQNPEVTLKKGIESLKGFTWWVSVGTAIGLYRDGDFIQNDTDIDIGIRANKDTPPVEINGMKLIRTQEWQGRIIQRAYIDDNECIFDVFYYYDDISPGRLVTVCENGIIKKPLFGVKDLETKYGKLPFLDPIEDYFLDRYGETWKIPQSVKGKYSPTL